jgi:type I restriction enzyme, S subunit
MVCIGTIGKCNLIERECAFNQQINSLTPIGDVDSRYLLVAARSRSFQDAAWKKSSSTTIAILNKGKWLSIPIPLPPLAEQKRIVAKVDEFMALCDRLEVQQQEREMRHAALVRASVSRFAEAPPSANLHFLFSPSYAIPPADLRKTILALAIQGKLVPQDPNDEPAETLCESDEELAAQSSFETPHGWGWTRLRGGRAARCACGKCCNLDHGTGPD